ncbi:hypothetical protein ACIQWR_20945 [Streptomyces sp. NPDC098789]|uniref:hypothetical protein n=1 Tax=Streptomyces sp. NPDC098789 TaxID=3366098 RepID=UPI0038177A67
MDMTSREVRIPLDQAVEVVQGLNELVVSLDRLVSRLGAGTADESTIGTFVLDRNVLRMLARARQVVDVALDAELSEEENLEVDALCERGRFFGAG